jgi:hypothetical protein
MHRYAYVYVVTNTDSKNGENSKEEAGEESGLEENIGRVTVRYATEGGGLE